MCPRSLTISRFSPLKYVTVTLPQPFQSYAKDAAKLAAPCAVTYLLFPTFPSVFSASR